MSDTWGKGSVNNNIGWGQAAGSATNNWGESQKTSWSGQTDIVGITPVSIAYSSSAFCADASDPTPTISNNAGVGTFSSTAGLVFISTTTGEVDLDASTAGATYVITYTDTDAATATFSLTINDLDNAAFAYSASSYTQADADPTPTITGLTGGTFSAGSGLVFVDSGTNTGSSTGEIDLSASTIASYTVTYSTSSSGSSVCPNTSTFSLAVTSPVDSDASAFFSRVTTAGGSLSTTEEQAVNTLVTDLKSANIWSKMSAIYPLVGASAAACAQNLKSSSYTGTFDGAWTYASTGVTGNGENNWMNTGLLPSTELSLNSTHLSVYSRTDTPTVTGDVDMGVNDTAFTLIEIWGGKFYSLINQNATGSNVSVSTSLGHFIGSRISSSEVKGFRNGSTILTSSTNSTNLATANIALAAMGAAGYSSAREYAFASIGEGLTDAEVSDFYTAVQAFQTTLSRNV